MMRSKLKKMARADSRCVAAHEVSSRRAQHSQNGFSILELVVVLLIMGIVAATATPSFYLSLRYHELESAARRVKLDLEQVQHAARVKSQAQALTFTNATTYTLSSGVESLKTAGGAYAVNLAKEPYEIDSAAVNVGGPTTISFDGYGNASVAGTIVLTRGDNTRTLTLESPSGRITISNP